MKNRMKFWDFNSRVFSETFRELRTVGILSIVILCLAAILLPMGQAISAISAFKHFGTEITKDVVSLFTMHPFIIAPMYTIAILLPLMAFGFLNKRNTADFYHATPVSRSALFISRFFAAFLWIVLSVIISAAASAVTCLCFPAVFQYNFSSILPTVCAVLAGSLLVSGCMSLAMCITGTLFNNILIAALMMGLPRLILLFVALVLQEYVHILPSSMNSPLLDISYNLPLGIVINGLFGNNASTALYNWHAILYTGVVGLILFFLCIPLFRVRHSEAATRPASTPLLQHVFRLTITFLVTLIPLWMVFGYIQNHTQNPETTGIFIFVMLALYIVAALVFVIYELITNKKPKNLLKVAKTFPIVLAVDVIVLVALLISKHSILAFRPAPEDITAISFQQGNGQDEDSYYNRLTADIRLNDKEITELVSARLIKAAEKNDPTGGMDNASFLHSRTFTVYTKYGAHQRRLCFEEPEIEKITATLSKNTEYQLAYNLPALSDNINVTITDLSDEEAKAVYQSLRLEMSSLPFEKRFPLLNGATITEEMQQTITPHVNVQVVNGADTYYFGFALWEEYFPKSYEKYINYLFTSQTKDRSEIINVMKTVSVINEGDDGEVNFSFELCFPDGHRSMLHLTNFNEANVNGIIRPLAQYLSPNKVPGVTDTVLFVYCDTSQKVMGDGKIILPYYSYEAYFCIDEEGIALAEKWFEQM